MIIIYHGARRERWLARLTEMLRNRFKVVSKRYDAGEIVKNSADIKLIILDATAGPTPEPGIASCRRRFPSAAVVVVAASPTWGSARAAFQAGATDYVSKSATPDQALAAILPLISGQVVNDFGDYPTETSSRSRSKLGALCIVF